MRKGIPQFDFTPEEAQQLAASFKASELRGRSVFIEESPWVDSPLRTTFYYESNNEAVLFEVQGSFNLHGPLKDLAQWLRSQRKSSRLFIVLDQDEHVRIGDLNEMGKLGIGLILCKDGQFIEHSAATNPTFLVDFDETWRLRSLKARVRRFFNRFNQGESLAAFRDICEQFEFSIYDLLRKTNNAGWYSPQLTAVQIDRMDLNGAICKLGTSNNLAPGKHPPISAALTTDCHSLRGARNLADHPPKTRKEAMSRQQQLKERMLMAARLLVQILDVSSKIR